jgi:hypothetical protein
MGDWRMQCTVFTRGFHAMQGASYNHFCKSCHILIMKLTGEEGKEPNFHAFLVTPGNKMMGYDKGMVYKSPVWYQSTNNRERTPSIPLLWALFSL